MCSAAATAAACVYITYRQRVPDASRHDDDNIIIASVTYENTRFVYVTIGHVCECVYVCMCVRVSLLTILYEEKKIIIFYASCRFRVVLILSSRITRRRHSIWVERMSI